MTKARNLQRFIAGTLGCLLLFGSCHAAESCAWQAGSHSAPEAPTILRASLAGVPALIRVPKVVKKPSIVLWHGLGPPGSEAELMTALPLDEVPAVKVYLGLPLLGARAPAPGTDSLGQRQAKDYALRIFEPVVVGAARELPRVLVALQQRKCHGASGKIGLFGFSAGGAAVLVALTEPNIPVGVAVTVNAPAGLSSAIDALERATQQPYAWSEPARQLANRTDPVLHAREIATTQPPPALLLLHGAEDAVISPTGSAALEKALRPLYAAHEDRLSLLIVPGVSHNWTAAATLDQTRRQVADWFNRYL
jgi:dienelactone hydrolase